MVEVKTPRDETFRVRTRRIVDDDGSTEFAVPDVAPASKLFPAVLSGPWVNDEVSIAVLRRDDNGNLLPHSATTATAIAKVTKEDARLFARELLRIANEDSTASGGMIEVKTCSPVALADPAAAPLGTTVVFPVFQDECHPRDIAIRWAPTYDRDEKYPWLIVGSDGPQRLSNETVEGCEVLSTPLAEACKPTGQDSNLRLPAATRTYYLLSETGSDSVRKMHTSAPARTSEAHAATVD
jgi:hypothetical protein